MVKIGDRVQIYETCSNYYGRCGIVIGDDFCPTFPYEVEFEDGDDCIFKGKDLIVLSTEEETTMLFEVGDEVRVRQPTNLFHSELGKVVSIDHVKLTYKVVFHRGNSDVYTCFDLILVKRQEEKAMKFKVGDKVKILNTEFGNKDNIGTIENISGTTMIYFVKLDGSCNSQWSDASDLELVEEETSMKFKVGDKVKVSNSWEGRDGEIGQIVAINVYNEFTHEVRFEYMGAECFREEDLELVKEEEKVMKFKVGDKVKVKDSWFGFTGEVGLIVRIDGPAKYPYRVKFDVVDEEDEELFAEGSLELVKEKAEKQSFTKSDLKTGMGVVLRNGRKGHVLVDTGCVDVIRFLENGNYSCLNDFSDDLTSNYKQHDIAEVYFTEYQFKLFTEGVFEQECVFKREEPKPEPKPEPEPTKMTMKEINEHFGKAIEIVE